MLIYVGADYAKIAPTLLLITTNLLREITVDNLIDSGTFNIYTEYSIQNALSARDILKEFHEHIKTLLMQFEDHPALQQVVDSLIFLFFFLEFYSEFNSNSIN